MIPNNPTLRDQQELAAPFIYPDNIAALDYLTDFEMGPVASQDPSLGINYQVWKGYWDESDETAYIHPLDSPEGLVPLFQEEDVENFTFTFDSNGRWTAAVRKSDDTVKFHWYDTTLEDYTVTQYSGIVSLKLAHDDKRDRQVLNGATDVILTYLTTSGQLKWRIQRDRYGTEYTYSGQQFSPQHIITHFGMNTHNRLQWRFGFKRFLPDGHCS